jgi:hypothetical protein
VVATAASWQQERRPQPSGHYRHGHCPYGHFHFRGFSVRLRMTLTTGASKSRRYVTAVQSQAEIPGDTGSRASRGEGIAWPGTLITVRSPGEFCSCLIAGQAE